MTLPLEQVVGGKYEILEKLKEGGIGAIYKVRHRLLDEVRVIKVLRGKFADDDEVRQRFHNEARAAIRLRHPNIAHLFDFSLDDEGTGYIVMEHIDGVTLQELVQHSGPPSLNLALDIAGQCLSAIGYLHKQGFIHRDIASDNLMLTRDYEDRPLVKLIDLGIAKGGRGGPELTATGMFLGKVRYSAPEQFAAKGGATQLSRKSDLYSFGIVLYELVTGRSPIRGKSFSDVVAGHLFKPPVPFEESDPEGRVPAELRRVILQALEKNPERRPASADDFAAALARFRGPVKEAESAEFTAALATTSSLRARAPAPKEGSTVEKLEREFGLDESSAGGGQAVAERTGAPPSERPPTPAPEPAAPEPAAPEPAAPEPRIRRPSPPPAPEARGPLPPPPAAPAGLAPTSFLPTTRPAAPAPTRRRQILVAGLFVLALLGSALAGFLIVRGLRGAAPTATEPPAADPGPPPSPEPAAPAADSRAGSPPRTGGAPAGAPAPEARAERRPSEPPVSPPAPPEPAPAAAPVDLSEIRPVAPGPGVLPPELVRRPVPRYPPLARQLRRGATVRVQVLVGDDGRVLDARTKDARPDELGFDAEAIEAARGALFRPATLDGQPRAMWAELEFVFGDGG